METKTIKDKVVFNANAHEVYEALMDSKKHAEFTGAAANISREVGGKFNAWDGYIEGENIELIPDRKIVQKWRSEEEGWPKGHFSTVTFELSEKNGKTILEFTQTNVPEKVYENIKQGWKDYYWQPMKKVLER